MYWLRAQRHAAYDDYCVLATQIEAVDAQPDDTVDHSWLFWMRAHTASYSLLMVQMIALAVWLLFFVALRRRAHWAIIMLLMAGSLFFVWLSVDMQKQWCRYYAVTSEHVPVYVGPNIAYHQQGAVRSAHVVTIVDEREGWYKITHKELAGWVQADKLVKV